MLKYRFQAGLLIVGCFSLQAAHKEFWEIKDASTWSNEEKQALLVQSPWAKEGFARVELEKKRPVERSDGVPGADARPDLKPGATPGAQRSTQFGGEVPPVPSNDPGPKVQFRVLARWETAKAVRLAGGPEVPEVTGQFYVLRLRGLPLMPPRKGKPGQLGPEPNPNEGILRAIKQGSRLERKNQPAIPCAHIFTGSRDNANDVLLFFSRGEADPITVADKLVTLESRFSAFHLSIKFPVKDMMYKGELSL